MTQECREYRVAKPLPPHKEGDVLTFREDMSGNHPDIWILKKDCSRWGSPRLADLETQGTLRKIHFRHFRVTKACRRYDQIAYMNAGTFTVLEEPSEVGMRIYQKEKALTLRREEGSGILVEDGNPWSMFAEHEIDALKKQGVLEELTPTR